MGQAVLLVSVSKLPKEKIEDWCSYINSGGFLAARRL